jgi:hypothetical protein
VVAVALVQSGMARYKPLLEPTEPSQKPHLISVAFGSACAGLGRGGRASAKWRRCWEGAASRRGGGGPMHSVAAATLGRGFGRSLAPRVEVDWGRGD